MGPGESSTAGAGEPPASRASARQIALGAVGGLALAIVLWGGYSHHWPWTGINGGTATLWDWLHLLMLPLAFAVLPIWFRGDTRVGRETKQRGLAVLAVFVLVVVLGYAVPWGWTGFTGNTLWDWFGLLFLPLSLVLLPQLLELRGRWLPRHSMIAVGGFVVFAALVAGGYLGKWTWTGFTGNTLWDWMNLLLLPLLLPTVILPALKPIATGRVVYLDQDGNPVEPEVSADDRSRAAGPSPDPRSPAEPSPDPRSPAQPSLATRSPDGGGVAATERAHARADENLT
jgi:hypothetical protein